MIHIPRVSGVVVHVCMIFCIGAMYLCLGTSLTNRDAMCQHDRIIAKYIVDCDNTPHFEQAH